MDNYSDFNKEQWLRDLKVMNKDWTMEKDQVFKPLILLKKENLAFIEDC
jgi:hypothetical protein